MVGSLIYDATPDENRRREDMRTVVVGASSGLGRCIAVDRAGRHDRVALLARRKELLNAAAAEAGTGNVPIVCDVTDELSCRAAIAEAVASLGGIDALVYATGIGPLQPIEQIDAETWRHTFNTNVVGAAIITSAALGSLRQANGVALYLSSVSASMARPWPGFSAYIASKAALDRMIEAFRVEHPGVGFTRVIVGDCAGGKGDAQTQFPTGSGWDMKEAARFMEVWQQRGYLSGGLVDVEDLVESIDFVLRSGASVPSISVVPRGPQER
jgi:NAD(P)-dependent dehydrogenase (short-subunit alcohol dehydrogenase family)